MKGCEGEGDMMGMMSKMMEGCSSDMMMDMMPHCCGMMVSKVPKEKRMEFVLKIVSALVEEGCSGLSEQEKKDFLTKVVEKVKL